MGNHTEQTMDGGPWKTEKEKNDTGIKKVKEPHKWTKFRIFFLIFTVYVI